MRLEGKRAIIAAAGQGIGRAIADAFRAEGANVWSIDRDPALLENVEQAIQLDLLDSDEIDTLPARTGGADILVNAAGVVSTGTLLDCDPADFDAAWALNVAAMYRMTRAYLPGMIEQRAGSIVNIASVASSLIGVPERFAYGTTKAAVIGLTKSVAADFVAKGVRCNAICPGTIETPSLLDRVANVAARDGISYDDAYNAFAGRQPVGRLGRTNEIAALAVYLASDESAFTTGTTAVIDGGWTVL